MDRLPVGPGPAGLVRRPGPIGPGGCLHRDAGSRPRSARRRPRGPQAPAPPDDPMPDANMGAVAASFPLPTLLSQALVAHTIELDNEAEHRLPHRTTRHEGPDAGRGGPWLVSFALWANVLQYSMPTTSRWRHSGAGAHEPTPPQRPPPVGVHHAHAAGGPAVAEAAPGRRHRARPTSRSSGAGRLVAPPSHHRRPLAAAPGRARLRPAGPGAQGRLRRAPHRPAGLPPGDPSHAGRQGRRAPSA